MKVFHQKILWQTHEAIVSGANIAMLEYIDALKNAFSFFVILPHKGTMQQELEQRNIPYRIIPQYGWTNRYKWWNIGTLIKVILRSVAAVCQTIVLIIVEKPTIVSTNTLVPFTASIAAWLKKIPHVWWIHEFGKEDFGFTTGWGNEKISLKWMQLSSKLIIGNSKAISNKFAKLMPKASIETIYQPVSWNSLETDVKVKQARFLMFGQLDPSKGHKDVLQAIVVNKQNGKPLHSLHIKGPCEKKAYLEELQQFVQHHDLNDFVKIEVGYFKKEEVIPQYDVMIVASQSEAFGRVIVEANKAGLRVVVKNGGGGSTELMNETNGLLYNSTEELSDILCGNIKLPKSTIKANYDEALELQKLNSILNPLLEV